MGRIKYFLSNSSCHASVRFLGSGGSTSKEESSEKAEELAGTGIVVSGATFTFSIACVGKIPFFAPFINFNQFYQIDHPVCIHSRN